MTPQGTLLPWGVYLCFKRRLTFRLVTVTTCHRPAICICSWLLHLPLRTREMKLYTFVHTPFRGKQPMPLYHIMRMLSNIVKMHYIFHAQSLQAAPQLREFVMHFFMVGQSKLCEIKTNTEANPH